MTEPEEFTSLPALAVPSFADRVSVVLDAVAVLGMAGGVGWGLWPWLGPFAVAVAGVLLSLLVFASSVLREPRREPPLHEAPRGRPGPDGPARVSGD
jgi:hypothetical protein